MRCSHPNYCLDLGLKENGKRFIKFLPRRVDLYSMKQLSERYGKESVIPMPCGKCLNCRINHAKEWAVRCVLESLYHDDNYFITLTYDDEHLPSDGLLYRRDVQLFLKRLRKRIGSFRYFGCGEYGGKTHRPHYHLILFGAKLPDLKSIGAGLFESQIMKEVWPFGFNTIGFVTYSSCNYVATYTTKKVLDPMGDYCGEFCMSSTNPGIGYQWCKDHLKTVLDYDSVFGDFGNTKCMKMPRYFEKIAEILDQGTYLEVKAKRLDKTNALEINKMLVHSIDRVEMLLEYEENITLNDFIARKAGRKL